MSGCAGPFYLAESEGVEEKTSGEDINAWLADELASIDTQQDIVAILEEDRYENTRLLPESFKK